MIKANRPQPKPETKSIIRKGMMNMNKKRSTTVIKASILSCICAVALSLPFAVTRSDYYINAEGNTARASVWEPEASTTTTTSATTDTATPTTTTASTTSTTSATTTTTTATETTTQTTTTEPAPVEPEIVYDEQPETYVETVEETEEIINDEPAETETESVAATTVCPVTGYELLYNDTYYVVDYPLTKSGGVLDFNGHHETYYDEKVLPGPGLNIPGRHVSYDGTIRDGDGYICVAAHPSYMAKGAILLTSRGPAKVYDTGCDWGTIDLYVNW
jgi:cytoskeletal protein RodZ